MSSYIIFLYNEDIFHSKICLVLKIINIDNNIDNYLKTNYLYT